MNSLRRRLWRCQRSLCTIRFLCVIVGCCLLVELSRGYSIGERQKIDQENIIQEQRQHQFEKPERKKVNEFELGPNADNHRNVGNASNLQAPHSERVQRQLPIARELPDAIEPTEPVDGKQEQHEQIFKRESDPVDQEPVKKITFYDNVIVHFDLKGATPKVSYLKEVMRLVRANGATGILLEWEDTFPWTGIFSENRCTDAYSVEDVKDILGTAQKLGLDIIPLVQTFGHLEWILKLEKFRKFRENDMFPQVVCLADNEGVNLVKEALKQVIELHKPFGIKYFHVGADEAFEYGVCEKDMDWIQQNPKLGKEFLAATHLRKVADHVHSFVPNAKILAWHDMLKTFHDRTVKEIGLDDVIEPVVWDYSETIQQQNELTWTQLAQSFRTVWGSSAYKGANNPSAQYSDIQHYMKNNKGWITHKQLYGSKFETFRGLILTGWQRYDHFAALCEILPAGIPSAIVNLQVAHAGLAAGSDVQGADDKIKREVGKALHCMQGPNVLEAAQFASCVFPGSEIFNLIHVSLPQQKRMIESEVYENHHVKGWLGRSAVRHNYSQLWYLNLLKGSIDGYYMSMFELERKIRTAMAPVFHQGTIDEWVFEYLDPTTEKLKQYLDDINKLMNQRTFPVRSFPIRRHLQLPNDVRN